MGPVQTTRSTGGFDYTPGDFTVTVKNQWKMKRIITFTYMRADCRGLYLGITIAVGRNPKTVRKVFLKGVIGGGKLCHFKLSGLFLNSVQ